MAIQLLSGYNKTPPNGVAIFCGLTSEESAKKKTKISLAIEPPRPLKSSIYLCGKRFEVAEVKSLFQIQDTAEDGFVLISGSETMVGRINLNLRSHSVQFRIRTKLPNNHCRGGWSQGRYSRLRDEAIHNYLRKIAEACKQVFLSPSKDHNDAPVLNVRSLLFAGPGELKSELLKRTDLLDQRLHAKILGVLSTSQGGEAGIQELLNTASYSQLNLQKASTEENKLLTEFYGAEEGRETFERCAIGPKECQFALKNCMVEWLIIHEEIKKDSPFAGLIELKKSSKNLKGDVSALLGYAFRGELDVVSDATPRGVAILQNYEGVIARLHFECDLRELMSQEEVEVCEERKESKIVDQEKLEEVRLDLPIEEKKPVSKLRYTGFEFIPRASSTTSVSISPPKDASAM